MATLGVLYVAGGSINMVSLFALIMALGIIVDDAIVVGEDALTHYQLGEGSLAVAQAGPTGAGSGDVVVLTTVARSALMLVGGIIGNILFAIPLVICVIAASLVSFLILPGHRHTDKAGRNNPGASVVFWTASSKDSIGVFNRSSLLASTTRGQRLRSPSRA